MITGLSSSPFYWNISIFFFLIDHSCYTKLERLIYRIIGSSGWKRLLQPNSPTPTECKSGSNAGDGLVLTDWHCFGMNFSTTSSQKKLRVFSHQHVKFIRSFRLNWWTLWIFFHSDGYQETHNPSFCKLPSHAAVWSRNGFDVMPI